MLKPQGYSTIDDPDAPSAIEHDTAQCGHCQRVIFVKPGMGCTVYLIPQTVHEPGEQLPKTIWHEEMGAFCRVCMSPVCLPCHDLGRCLPWEKMLELAEAKGRTHRSIEQTLGRTLA